MKKKYCRCINRKLIKLKIRYSLINIFTTSINKVSILMIQ